MQEVKLVCPVHGVVAEFNYACGHIGDPLKGVEYCKYCGKKLEWKVTEQSATSWFYGAY